MRGKLTSNITSTNITPEHGTFNMLLERVISGKGSSNISSNNGDNSSNSSNKGQMIPNSFGESSTLLAVAAIAVAVVT